MHTETAVVIKAPLERIFQTASDLNRWPDILPHYRWIRFHEQSAASSIVNMAAWRGIIPIQWTSEYRIDTDKTEMHFNHLKAFTKGMHVVWRFTPTADGVKVSILHDLENRIPVLSRFINEYIIGRFFIGPVANKTLAYMKKHLEAE
jgi:ribosome-associated toxin RatA of RatAB toxin-antitoxin module